MKIKFLNIVFFIISFFLIHEIFIVLLCRSSFSKNRFFLSLRIKNLFLLKEKKYITEKFNRIGLHFTEAISNFNEKHYSISFSEPICLIKNTNNTSYILVNDNILLPANWMDTANSVLFSCVIAFPITEFYREHVVFLKKLCMISDFFKHRMHINLYKDYVDINFDVCTTVRVPYTFDAFIIEELLSNVSSINVLYYKKHLFLNALYYKEISLLYATIK